MDGGEKYTKKLPLSLKANVGATIGRPRILQSKIHSPLGEYG